MSAGFYWYVSWLPPFVIITTILSWFDYANHVKVTCLHFSEVMRLQTVTFGRKTPACGYWWVLLRFFVFVLFNHTNPQSLFAECRVLKTSYSRATRQSGSKSPSSTRRSKSPATGEKNERDESFNFINKKRFVQIWANARGTFTCIYLYLVVQLYAAIQHETTPALFFCANSSHYYSQAGHTLYNFLKFELIESV